MYSSEYGTCSLLVISSQGVCLLRQQVTHHLGLAIAAGGQQRGVHLIIYGIDVYAAKEGRQLCRIRVILNIKFW